MLLCRYHHKLGVDMNRVSRKEAIEKGLEYYFTGKPCINGHIAPRKTKWRGCSKCATEREKKRTGRWAKMTEEQKQKIRAAQRVENMTTEQVEKKRERSKRSYEKNRQWNLDRFKARRQSHGYYKEQWAKTKERMSADPAFKMRMVMSENIHRVFKKIGRKKEGLTIDYLGYSPMEFKEHLEKQFYDGMAWDNFGSYWHVDHITPVSVMIADGITDPAIINGLANLRPLLAKDNFSKSNKREFLL